MNDNTKITLTLGHLKRLINEKKLVSGKATEDVDGLLVCEMSNKWKAETGLPMNIWIDENKTYIKGKHSKRIKFQLNDSGKMNIDDSAAMDLDGTIWPKKLATPHLHDRQLTQLRNFIHNNRYALEKVADVLVPLYEIWPFIIKGGELASEEEINALNAKVDEIMAKQGNEK